MQLARDATNAIALEKACIDSIVHVCQNVATEAGITFYIGHKHKL